MEDARVLTISELLRRARPVTATASLSISIRPFSSSSSKTCKTPSSGSPISNPKILTPLEFPAILVGTLTLLSHSSSDCDPCSSNRTFRCPNNGNCLQFSDDSSTICCDVLHFDVRVVGKRIRVIAWNFLPLNCGGVCGGFLEIINWNFQDSGGGLHQCLNVVGSFSLVPSSISPCKDSSKARYYIHGVIVSVSPVTVVPTRTSQSDVGTTNIRGFLVQIMACDCKLCNLKESVSHSFTKCVFVYFSGSASSWHPVITKLIKNVVTFSGLKRKLVFIGKEESELMYVTTERTLLVPSSLPKIRQLCTNSFVKEKVVFGTYTGVIRGVYMHGMVVELDEEVWLLLSDQLLAPPHSLRVGALISVRNVHFVNPKFSWTNMRILGACFKTSIVMESFSPLETGCHVTSHSQSPLGKFIESLAFPARFWVLLVVSSLRKKFSGILSEKEILGSKHKEGLVQLYTTSILPSSVFRYRREVFREMCKHDSCGSGGEPYNFKLTLSNMGNEVSVFLPSSQVLPISNFICHCEALRIRKLFKSETECQILHDYNRNGYGYEGRSCGQSVRRILRSEKRCVPLLGNLKISPSTARLQLVDATGSVDVLIPNLPSTWDPNSIYEISDYSLVMEGMPDMVGQLGLLGNESFSCRSILTYVPLTRETNISVYVYFHWRDATCRKLPFYPCMNWKDDVQEIQSGTFHLLRVTHKFSMPHKFHSNSVISNWSTVFVEAIIFPWDLFLTEKDEGVYGTEVFSNQMESRKLGAGRFDQERVSSKRCKTNVASSSTTDSRLLGDNSDAGSKLKTCSNLHAETSEKFRCHSSNLSHEIPCFSTIRGVSNDRLVRSGILYCIYSHVKTGIGCKPSAQKVLLEFKSESFLKYQLLNIGGYYIIKHCAEDPFCNHMVSDYVNSVKIHITSKINLWSLSFSSDQVLPTNNSSLDTTLDNTYGENEVMFGDQSELLLQKHNGFSSATCSDIHLHLSSNVLGLLKINLKELEEDLIKSAGISKEIGDVTLSTGIITSVISSGSANCNSLFPEGNLISLCGDVAAIYNFDLSSNDANSTRGDVDWSRVFQGVTSTNCIHLLVDHQIVRVFGSLSKHAYPIGFGPGVNATFHRILELGGKNTLMLKTVSFIVINTVRAVPYPSSGKCYNFGAVSDMYNIASPDTVSSGLMYEFSQCSEGKPVHFHCRIVAVSILILENNRKNDEQSKFSSMPSLVDVPLAGFVLDDGSSSSCCWANAERATRLLRLHEEIPERAFETSSWKTTQVGGDKNACPTTTMYHLERIVKKHDRITVRNYGSMLDCSCQDLTVSVSSENTLSSSDENLLKFIFVNACLGKILTIVGSVMDSNVVGLLEKHQLNEMEMPMNSMQNIWAREVYYTDPLTQASSIIQELLKR